MRLFAVLFLCVFLIAFLAHPRLSGGLVWDAANALGFVALAAVLYLAVTTRGARDVPRHEWFAYGAIGLVLAHGFALLLADGAVAEYLKPGAPAYMWAGVGALVALMVSSLLAVLPARRERHRSYASFKVWHRVLGVAALAGAAWHVIGSGFYLSATAQIAALIVVCLWVGAARELRLVPPVASVASPAVLLAASLAGAVVFVALRYAP